MVHPIAVAALLGLGVAGAWAGLDFTPTESFYEVEGVRMPRLHFQNDGRPVPYTPPSEWRASGGGKSVSFLPPGKPQAGAVFEAVPMGPEPLENVRAFRKAAIDLLPPGSVKVEVISAAVSALRISRRVVVEVQLRYTFFAQPFRMTALFIPHDDELLRLRFAAHAADFDSLEQPFRRSLYSLQGL